MGERGGGKGNGFQPELHVEPLAPNTMTIEAMKAARRGEVVMVGRVSDLLADLQADD